eukprot:scaffold5959_cov18-Tisochrysis_lutea.AAC.1
MWFRQDVLQRCPLRSSMRCAIHLHAQDKQHQMWSAQDIFAALSPPGNSIMRCASRSLLLPLPQLPQGTICPVTQREEHIKALDKTTACTKRKTSSVCMGRVRAQVQGAGLASAIR